MTFLLNDMQTLSPIGFQPFVAPEIEIVDEGQCDIFARESLLDAAFGPARFDKTAQRLRDGRLPAPGLALAAKAAGALVGTLRLWPVDAGGVQALLLGPLAVAKTCRSRGIGRKLMAEGLFRAFAAGHKAILLVGDAPYYEPFGFARRHTLGLALPGPVDEARFLGLELETGALTNASGLVKAAGAFDFSAHRVETEFLYAA
ncbi:GNAT family N-acetyltransferase [Methylocapsa acidiphila]|uniref:GNAT family N-acetyltransferase n=1 Tax=Methylocapsa acidiphila TaxID=133552 RepID=UPI00041FE56D|nr:N-acetyltransferase [Methylocapsa acidiphila]